jgi:hypothetical protein
MHASPTLKSLTVAIYTAYEDQYASLAEALDEMLTPLVAVDRLELVHVVAGWIPDEERDLPPFDLIVLPKCKERGLVVVETEAKDIHSEWVVYDGDE